MVCNPQSQKQKPIRDFVAAFVIEVKFNDLSIPYSVDTIRHRLRVHVNVVHHQFVFQHRYLYPASFTHFSAFDGYRVESHKTAAVV